MPPSKGPRPPCFSGAARLAGPAAVACPGHLAAVGWLRLGPWASWPGRVSPDVQLPLAPAGVRPQQGRLSSAQPPGSPGQGCRPFSHLPHSPFPDLRDRCAEDSGCHQAGAPGSPGCHLLSQPLWPPGAGADEGGSRLGPWASCRGCGRARRHDVGRPPLVQTPRYTQGQGPLLLLAHLCCSQSVPWGHCCDWHQNVGWHPGAEARPPEMPSQVPEGRQGCRTLPALRGLGRVQVPCGIPGKAPVSVGRERAVGGLGCAVFWWPCYP